MARARSPPQQPPRRMQTRAGKVRDAASESAVVRPAAKSSPAGKGTAASGGLREQQQLRVRRQGSGRSPGDATEQQQKRKKRKKRSSLGSVGSSAFGGSESSMRSSSSQTTATPSSQEQQERLRLYGDPDVVLHVGGCSFETHFRVLKAQSRELYSRMKPLRGQWVGGDAEHDDSAYFSSLSISSSVHDRRAVPVALPPFALRAVDGSRYLNTSLDSELALSSTPVQCPLAKSRTAATARALSRGKRRKTEKLPERNVFTTVQCIAHASSNDSNASTISLGSSSKSDLRASPRERLKSVKSSVFAGSPMVLRSQTTMQKRGRGTFAASMVAGTAHFTGAESPIKSAADRGGKENWGGSNSQSPDTPRGLQRLEQEQEEQKEQQQQQAAHKQQEASQHEEEVQIALAQQQQEPDDLLHQEQQLAAASAERKMLHVEWRHADPAAVASLLEFFYSQQVRLATDDNAEHVIQLCRWLHLEDELLYACLSIAIERVTSEKWMVLLLVCSKLKDKVRQKVLVEELFEVMRKVPVERYAEILENVQMVGLGAIRDHDLLSKVVMCFTNHIRHVGVWRNVLYSLEMWTSWAFRRNEPLSLLEFHRQYAHWDPFVRLPGVEIGGEEFYVRPKTLFRFGQFAVQVRFELESLVLIQWRVVKEEDAQGNLRDGVKLHSSDPMFVLRGEMLVRFKCYKKGPTHDQAISLHYTHSVPQYGVWKPLVVSSSETAKLLTKAEIRGPPRAGEAPPSQSDSVTASQSEPEPHEAGEPAEFMRARFMGRFFVWGHRLCNESHFLSVSTLFYSSPTGSVGDLLNLDVIEKMRKLPVDSLVLVLQSDRLRIPGGETMLVRILTHLCFHVNYSNNQSLLTTDFSAINIVNELFSCVRWCFADLSQIMVTLERARRKYRLYELIVNGLSDPLLRFPRRRPWGHSHDPYQIVTSLVEFEIEAGDQALSPSCCTSQDVPSQSAN